MGALEIYRVYDRRFMSCPYQIS